MIIVCICDNNSDDIALLKGYIEVFAVQHSYDIDILILRNPEDLTSLKYDILFLDIYLGEKENGIDIGKKLRNNNNNCIINFVTSLSNFSMESFKTDALRFLLKPVIQESVSEAMTASIKKLELDRFVIKIRCVEGDALFNIHDIIYIASTQRKREIVCKYGSYFTWESFDTIQSKISSPLFTFAHKSFLVNLEHIDYINDGWIYLRNRSSEKIDPIKISRGRANHFLESVEKYIGGTSGLCHLNLHK